MKTQTLTLSVGARPAHWVAHTVLSRHTSCGTVIWFSFDIFLTGLALALAARSQFMISKRYLFLFMSEAFSVFFTLFIFGIIWLCERVGEPNMCNATREKNIQNFARAFRSYRWKKNVFHVCSMSWVRSRVRSKKSNVFIYVEMSLPFFSLPPSLVLHRHRNTSHVEKSLQRCCQHVTFLQRYQKIEIYGVSRTVLWLQGETSSTKHIITYFGLL